MIFDDFQVFPFPKVSLVIHLQYPDIIVIRNNNSQQIYLKPGAAQPYHTIFTIKGTSKAYSSLDIPAKNSEVCSKF